MSWIELSINTTAEAVDWVNTLLATTNYRGEVYITAYVKPDLQSAAHQDTGHSAWTFTICLYLPYDVHANAHLEAIAHRLSPLWRTGQSSELQTAVIEETPVKASSPRVHRIGQRFVVLPHDSSYQSDRADEITLKLKNSLAFGSGLHPTTLLSLQLLERHILSAMQALDLGSGSGILSVAMAKLGASVLALDNDPVAVQATQDAVYRNGMEQQVTVLEGSLGSGGSLGHWMGGDVLEKGLTIQPAASFDCIVANVMARIHIALTDDFRRALRQTDASAGLLLTAGFTTDYENEVSTALAAAGFEIIDCERLNEWVAIAYRLNVNDSENVFVNPLATHAMRSAPCT